MLFVKEIKKIRTYVFLRLFNNKLRKKFENKHYLQELQFTFNH